MGSWTVIILLTFMTPSVGRIGVTIGSNTAFEEDGTPGSAECNVVKVGPANELELVEETDREGNL